MTKFIILLSFNIFFYFHCFSQTKKEIKFYKTENRVNNTICDFDSLIFLFRLDTIQLKSEKGIKFEIKIFNISDSSIKIHNPLDLVNIMLLDSNTNDLALSENYERKYSHRFNKPFFYNSFTFYELSINGLKSTLYLPDEDSLTIPANSRIQISLGINKVKKVDDNNRVINGQSTLIKKGKYKLFMYAGYDLNKKNILDIPPTEIIIDLPVNGKKN